MKRVTKSSATRGVAEEAGGGSKFWSPVDLKNETQAVLRLIPAQDSVTELPWTLTKFHYVRVGYPGSEDGATIRLPSSDMYRVETTGNSCDLANQVRALYREADDEFKGIDQANYDALRKIASAHWVKRQYSMAAFIMNGVEGSDENEIRLIRMPKQLFDVVKNTFDSSAYENLVCGGYIDTDVKARRSDDPSVLEAHLAKEEMTPEQFEDAFRGHDLIVAKSQLGGFNNYDRKSSFVAKTSQPTDAQLDTILESGFPDLRKEFVPAQPTEQAYEIMNIMMECSIKASREGNLDALVMWEPEFEKILGFTPQDPTKSRQNGHKPATSAALDNKFAPTTGAEQARAVNEKMRGQNVSDILERSRARGSSTAAESKTVVESEGPEEDDDS